MILHLDLEYFSVQFGGECMFYYYGRKKQIARYYPAPEQSLIIEPFAGAASYALHEQNWKNEVILIEKDKKVSEIWRWLIEEATPSSIEKLPNLSVGEKSSEFLHIIHAATKMAFKYKTIKTTPVLARNWEISKRVMASNVYKVKHWKIINADYSEAPNVKATWFIDPPYKADAGEGYAHGSSKMDYKKLAIWIKNLKGQVICCEGAEGDYLPFNPLLELPGIAGKRSKEFVFIKSSVSPKQPSFTF